MGLSSAVVRVLAEDHHFGVGVCRQVERAEYLAFGRVNREARTFVRDERLERGPVHNSTAGRTMRPWRSEPLIGGFECS